MPAPTYHYVNTSTGLFTSPFDCEVPSTEHPCIPVTGQAVVSIKLGKAGEAQMSEILTQQLPDGATYNLTMSLPASLAQGITFAMEYTTEAGIVGHLDSIPFDDMDVRLFLEKK